MTTATRTPALDRVLKRMDEHARRIRLLAVGACAVEGLVLVLALMRINFSDTTQLLIFLFAFLQLSMLALGLFALGSHVSRVGGRVVAALVEARGS